MVENITLKNARKKANEFCQKDLPFSELKYSKLIFEKTGKAIHQLRYADALRLCGYYKQAEELYLSIPIRKLPKDIRPFYYLNLGFIYKDIGNLKKALECYLKSLRLKSDHTMTYVFIADILKIQEKDKVAIKYLTIALTKEGSIDEVNYNLSTSYIRVGKLENALAAIQKCLEIDPKFPNAKNIKKDIEQLFKLDKIELTIEN